MAIAIGCPWTQIYEFKHTIMGTIFDLFQGKATTHVEYRRDLNKSNPSESLIVSVCVDGVPLRPAVLHKQLIFPINRNTTSAELKGKCELCFHNYQHFGIFDVYHVKTAKVRPLHYDDVEQSQF